MNVGVAPVLCKVCRQPLERAPQGGYGHVVNPKQFHHYPRPIFATLTEAEAQR